MIAVNSEYTKSRIKIYWIKENTYLFSRIYNNFIYILFLKI